jgi:hypothetical protein
LPKAPAKPRKRDSMRLMPWAQSFNPDYAQNEPAERWSRSFAAPVIE